MDTPVDRSLASIFLAFVVIYIVVFLPVAVGEFGNGDDFSMLVNYQSGAESFWFNTHFAWGRPLLGIYDGILFRLATTVSDFGWIRLLGVIGTGLFAGLLFRLYSRNEEPDVAALYAIGISTTPAFAEFIGWATCSAHAYASLLALAAGILATPGSATGDVGWKRIVGACACLFAAECIYQPAASFFLLPLIVALTFLSGKSLDVRRWSVPLAAFLGTVVIYFFFTRAVTKLFFEGSWLAERMETERDLGGKLAFLAQDTLPAALQGWGAVFSLQWAWVALVLTVVLLVAAAVYLGRLSNPVSRIVLILFACGLGVAPLVAAGENYTPPRTLPFVYGVVFHFAAFGLVSLLRPISVSVLRWGVRAVSIGLLGVASAGVFLGFVHPGMIETALVREEVRRTEIVDPSLPIVVLLPQWYQVPGTRVPHFHSFGGPSSWAGWGTEAKITMILREQGRLSDNEVAEVIAVQRGHAWDSRFLPVVDLFGAFGVDALYPHDGRGPYAVEWGALGFVMEHAYGWKFSPWLGYFVSWHPDELRHPHLGVVRVEEGPGGVGVILDTERLGRLRVTSFEEPPVFQTDVGKPVDLEFSHDGSVRKKPSP